MPLPMQATPPAVVAPAPSLKEVETDLLEAFDLGQPLPPMPSLAGKAALSYRWLRSAATFDPSQALPASPFPAGRARQEADALRRLLKAPKAHLPAALKAQPLHESGTALALWRWGQAQVRTGVFDAALRQAWEDRLLAAGPDLTRGYALRHALCWALAERDEARFASLKARPLEGTDEVLAGFQRLFGLLDGPPPVLRLWSLPGLTYRDLHLDQLGAARVWVRPAEVGVLPALPTDTAWIIPSASGSLGERDASLSGTSLAEGQALAERFRADGRTAQFAPSQSAFQEVGLSWFPILLVMDEKGMIRSIRMGDAAPDRP